MALHRLAGAGAQREERAEHPERDRDRRREHDKHERAADAGLERTPTTSAKVR